MDNKEVDEVSEPTYGNPGSRDKYRGLSKEKVEQIERIKRDIREKYGV